MPDEVPPFVNTNESLNFELVQPKNNIAVRRNKHDTSKSLASNKNKNSSIKTYDITQLVIYFILHINVSDDKITEGQSYIEHEVLCIKGVIAHGYQFNNGNN